MSGNYDIQFSLFFSRKISSHLYMFDVSPCVSSTCRLYCTCFFKDDLLTLHLLICLRWMEQSERTLDVQKREN